MFITVGGPLGVAELFVEVGVAAPDVGVDALEELFVGVRPFVLPLVPVGLAFVGFFALQIDATVGPF
jgi:hypothetical protein